MLAEGEGGKMMIYGIKGGAKLSLIPSPALIVRSSGWHVVRFTQGRKKKILVSTVCAYAGFHETEDIPGYFRHN